MRNVLGGLIVVREETMKRWLDIPVSRSDAALGDQGASVGGDAQGPISEWDERRTK